MATGWSAAGGSGMLRRLQGEQGPAHHLHCPHRSRAAAGEYFHFPKCISNKIEFKKHRYIHVGVCLHGGAVCCQEPKVQGQTHRENGQV